MPKTSLKVPGKKVPLNLLTRLIVAATIGRMDNLYTPQQAARVLGVHRTTVFRWIAAGKLATLRVADRRVITQEEIDKARAEKTESEVLA